MPSVNGPFNPPIQYNRIWMILGFMVLALIPVSLALAFWLTRRRPFQSIDSLANLKPGSELDKLKAKYLQIIDQFYQAYSRGELSLRDLHHDLSMAARYFVYEARHFPAPVLTLEDIKLAPYPELTKLIADYYPKEFASMERGKAADSVAVAKDFVQRWV